MRAWRYALLAALVTATIVLLVVALAGGRERSDASQSLAPGQAIAASANVTPQSHLFGELIHVRVDAVADVRRLNPDRLRLRANWSPYQPVAPMRRTRTDIGSFARLRWDVDLQCIIVDCAPNPGSAVRTTFRPATIAYSGPSARSGFRPIRIRWPVVSLFSRIDPVALEQHATIVTRSGQNLQLRAVLPPWRVTSEPIGAVSYRVSPSVAFGAALALALACILVAAALVKPWLPHFGRKKRQPRSRLEQALDAVDRTRGGASTEERKALELLAAELRRAGRGELAWTATELAWSPLSPEPARTGALAAAVRRDLEARTNGRRA